MRKKHISFLMFLLTHVAFAQNAFQKAYNTNPRASKENIRIDFSDSAGNSGHLPISILKGKQVGPVFTIVAGVHGYEYPPIIATQNILQEIDVAQLKGTVLIVPIANTASFYTRTPYINPQDQKNLNNAFPGNTEGSITEQIARFMTDNIIPVSDVFLDVHGGDSPEDLLPFVCYYDNTNKPDQTALAKKLSEESGFQYVVSYPYTISDEEPAKYAFKQAVQDGKTGVSIECGKLGTVQEENVSLTKTAIYNMLAVMGMYGEVSGTHPSIIHRNSQTYMNSSVRGIFYTEYKAGDRVKEGDIVGYTTDEFGNELEKYKAINDGIILYMLATPPINIGDTVMCISAYIED